MGIDLEPDTRSLIFTRAQITPLQLLPLVSAPPPHRLPLFQLSPLWLFFSSPPTSTACFRRRPLRATEFRWGENYGVALELRQLNFSSS